jgi:hypothetical protein
VPDDVWWRTWRTSPANFDWQGQVPQGSPVTYVDPQSHNSFTVFEGHYTYGDINFVPSWGGSIVRRPDARDALANISSDPSSSPAGAEYVI